MKRACMVLSARSLPDPRVPRDAEGGARLEADACAAAQHRCRRAHRRVGDIGDVLNVGDIDRDGHVQHRGHVDLAGIDHGRHRLRVAAQAEGRGQEGERDERSPGR